ncbi:hypothetical protein CYMTET_36630, partial [Cymbomonas tetramitiformis]
MKANSRKARERALPPCSSTTLAPSTSRVDSDETLREFEESTFEDSASVGTAILLNRLLSVDDGGTLNQLDNQPENLKGSTVLLNSLLEQLASDDEQADDADGTLMRRLAEVAERGEHRDGSAAVKSLLDNAGKQAIEIRDSAGDTALHFACSWGLVRAVRLLVLEDCISLNCRNKDGAFPLHKAAEGGQARHFRYTCMEAGEGVRRVTSDTPAWT